MPGAGRPRWGWHQLADPWARLLVDQACIRPGDVVLDIGAGAGVLTARLVAVGARVVAVELHAGRAERLRQRFAGAPVTVVQADAADLRLPGRPFKVVANPPFAVTTAVLRRLLSRQSALAGAALVVPDYAAARWAGGRGVDARKWQAVFDVRAGVRLPPSAFTPPGPPARVLTIHRRPRPGA
ncbi:MAG: rRNA (adenine-N6)-dimethyltransferase [Acidimicrobiaceae bacterium]|nr:rRNA (adenine-N6)-dimethyltransferase [Acidimicrobiaceae bacterium]